MPFYPWTTTMDEDGKEEESGGTAERVAVFSAATVASIFAVNLASVATNGVTLRRIRNDFGTDKTVFFLLVLLRHW